MNVAYGQVLLWAFVMLAGWVIIAQFTKSPRLTTWRFTQSAAIGFALMFVLNWATPYTHLHIPFNPFTALSAGLFGAPGVIGIAAVKLFGLA